MGPANQASSFERDRQPDGSAGFYLGAWIDISCHHLRCLSANSWYAFGVYALNRADKFSATARITAPGDALTSPS